MKNFFLIALLLTPFYSLSQGGENNGCADQPEGTEISLTIVTDTLVSTWVAIDSIPIAINDSTVIYLIDSIVNYDTLIVTEVVTEICGCTDSSATNYYPQSTLDNGLCEYSAGCIDPSACNYNPGSFESDGSCLFSGDSCDDGNATTINDTVNDSCECDGEGVVGCTNINACNYDSWATENDGSCLFPGEPCDDGDVLTTFEIINNSCECEGELSLQECIDQPEGTVIESWVYVFVTDTNGNVVDSLGVAVTETCGCADSSATNYYPQSTLDNGLCEYASECANQPEGTEISLTVVTDTLVSTWVAIDSIPIAINDSTVIYLIDSIVNSEISIVTDVVTEICGCTDSSATNYYPQSTLDNGLCEYANDCANQPEGSTFLSFWTDTIVTPVVVEGDTLIYDTLIVTEVVTETCGCADSSATNYYPQSTLDNGLCEYSIGCINPNACNYNPVAVESDGSCLFPGDPCDDNDATTTNDMFDDDCECQGDESSQVAEEVLDMALYPNPVRDWLSVRLEDGMAASLILFDPAGRVVQTWNTVGSTRLDLRHLPSGQYVMSIRPQIGPITSERISLLD